MLEHSSAVEWLLPLAAAFASMIQRAPDLELLAPVTVAFRFTGTATARDVDRINREIPTQWQRRGNVFPTGAILGDRPVLRVCLLNPLAAEDDLRLLSAQILTVGGQLNDG